MFEWRTQRFSIAYYPGHPPWWSSTQIPEGQMLLVTPDWEWPRREGAFCFWLGAEG